MIRELDGRRAHTTTRTRLAALTAAHKVVGSAAFLDCSKPLRAHNVVGAECSAQIRRFGAPEHHKTLAG